METNEKARASIESDDATPDSERAADQITTLLDPDVLGSLTVDLVAQLGRGSITIAALAALKSGEVLPLDTQLNGLVDITLNGVLVARGEIVGVDDQFGVRISDILVRKQ